MNRDIVDKIAQAVLYEGFILYPYRPSVKNRQRWTFGGIYPKAWSESQKGSDACTMQTQCLIDGSVDSLVEISVRFLHLTDRIVGKVRDEHRSTGVPPVPAAPDDPEHDSSLPPFDRVDCLHINGKQHHSWQEAVERNVAPAEIQLGHLLDEPQHIPFAFRHRKESEPLLDENGTAVGVLVREQQAIAGVVAVSAQALSDRLFRLTVVIENLTPFSLTTRDDALLHSLVSTHARLGVTHGQFISLTDAPSAFANAAADCRNIGCWPILVGEEGDTSTLLCSPIILQDYPQIAPQSPGELFDGGEIDEILTLRIMTLTDEEKLQMAAVDERTRAMLARTESLAREQLMALHGVMHPPEQRHA